MPLRDIITGPERVLLGMKAHDRWSAIDELIGHLVAVGELDPALQDTIAELIRSREETMSTGVGHGIGIPHAASPHVTEIIGAFGVCRNGIDFDALDGQPVYLVMLFVVPEAHFQEHLDTLAEVSRSLANPERRDALRQATDATVVVRMLREGLR